MNNKQFVVIGLGRFGSSVAKTLYESGHDVLAIDKDEDLVQEISDSVTPVSYTHLDVYKRQGIRWIVTKGYPRYMILSYMKI